MEVKSELTDVVRHLTDRCAAAASGAGGSDAAGVARVPDVGVVGGDRGPTGGGGDHAAHTEPGRAGSLCAPGSAGALRGGVARPYRRGGTGAGTDIVGELDYAEQRELL